MMIKHEEKHCPRCQIVFECKAGNIMQCQCNTIQLAPEERVYIESTFDECLCVNCLRDLQKEYILSGVKHIHK